MEKVIAMFKNFVGRAQQTWFVVCGHSASIRSFGASRDDFIRSLFLIPVLVLFLHILFAIAPDAYEFSKMEQSIHLSITVRLVHWVLFAFLIHFFNMWFLQASKNELWRYLIIRNWSYSLGEFFLVGCALFFNLFHPQFTDDWTSSSVFLLSFAPLIALFMIVQWRAAHIVLSCPSLSAAVIVLLDIAILWFVHWLSVVSLILGAWMSTFMLFML